MTGVAPLDRSHRAASFDVLCEAIYPIGTEPRRLRRRGGRGGTAAAVCVGGAMYLDRMTSSFG